MNSILAFALISLLVPFSIPMAIWWAVPQYVPLYTLVPRLTLSLRAFYAHDIQGRSSDIDTAFGFSSARGTANMVVFAGPEQSVEWDEEMILEERGVGDALSAGGAN